MFERVLSNLVSGKTRRRVGPALARILALCGLLPMALHAATFTVDNTADAVDAAPGNGVCATAGGVCTLRAAIEEANAFAGADTINMPAGTFNLTLNADLVVTEQMTLAGAGQASTIVDGQALDRVFEISAGVIAVITEITVRNGDIGGGDGGGIRNLGDLTLRDVTVRDSSAGDGGGIDSRGATSVLTLLDVTVTNNTASEGGGIYHRDVGATLTVTGGSITDNTASGFGGGIRNERGDVTMSGVTVSGNTAKRGGGVWNKEVEAVLNITNSTFSVNTSDNEDGGAIFNDKGTVTINTVTFDNNTGTRDGGALYSVNSASTVTITDSTFSSNQTNSEDGGAIYFEDGTLTINRATLSGNTAARDGGGIWSRDASTTLTNVTLSGNSAPGDEGGAFRLQGGTATLTNATITGNSASSGGGLRQDSGTLQLFNTIVANSPSGGNCSGTITSLGNNLDSANTCNLTGPGDLINSDPLLGPLQNNGGPTLTHAIPGASPAVDTGNNTGCPATDQRGVARPLDGDSETIPVCDIGAYEAPAGALTGANLGLTKTDSMDPVTPGTLFSYMLTVTNTGPDDATGVILTDTLPATVTFQSVTPSQGSCSHSGGSPGGTVTCNLGDISNGGNATVQIVVTAPLVAGNVVNNASVTGNESDPNVNNNAAAETTTIGGNVNRLCYLVADAGGGNGGDDLFTMIDTADFNPLTNETNIGTGTGTTTIEAIAWNAATGVLFAADAGQLGTLNLTTGVFQPRPQPFGTGNGALGSITFSDVDGLTYDATLGILYGVHARGGSDVLIQIDMTSGAHVSNAFGAGVDYVVIPPVLGNDITDDIAVDPTTGVMYATVNSGGNTDRLITINKFTGASGDIAQITVPDIEGLGTDFTGQLWGTSGTQNILYEISKTTGVGSNGRPIDNGSDYESVDCYAASPSISADLGLTKVVDDATPDEGDTVTFTVTVTNTGPAPATSVQINDPLPAGVTFVSAVASQGIYDAGTGNWFVGVLGVGGNATLDIQATVDAGTGGTTITNTANVAFLSQIDSNPSNDVASVDINPVGEPDIQVMKTVSTFEDPVNGTTDPKAIPGAIVLYTIQLTNLGTGPADADSVLITEPIPTDLWLRVADFDGSNAGPVAFVDGTPASGLSYTFVALGDGGDDVEFSNDGGSTYTYTPVPDANGVDTTVTHIRINPKGTFLSSTSGDPNFEVLFKAVVQ